MRATLTVIVLFAAVSAHATFEFEPIAPTDRSYIHLQVREMWRDGCVPGTPGVTRSGNVIEVMWVIPGGGCPLAVTRWNKDAPIGTLPAGVYDVVVKVDDRGTILTLVTKQLIVTESAPAFSVDPRVVSATAPGEVQLPICEYFFPVPASLVVEIDGVAVPWQVDANACHLTVTLRPHAPGPVDVTVRAGSSTYTAINAIHFVDPAGAPEPSLYERVLVPILYDGPGAYGSQWLTETQMFNASGREVRFLPDVSRPLTSLAPGAETSLSLFGQRPSGLVLFVPRGEALHFGSIVRDVSRDAEDFGTEVPVARERDTDSTLYLPNVPFDSRYRLQLRIYDIDGRSGGVAVRGGRLGPAGTQKTDWVSLQIKGPCEEGSVPTCNSNQPAYVSIDLTEELALLAGSGRQPVWIEPSFDSRRLWAFVTVTNNETQRVTVISPQ